MVQHDSANNTGRRIDQSDDAKDNNSINGIGCQARPRAWSNFFSKYHNCFIGSFKYLKYMKEHRRMSDFEKSILSTKSLRRRMALATAARYE